MFFSQQDMLCVKTKISASLKFIPLPPSSLSPHSFSISGSKHGLTFGMSDNERPTTQNGLSYCNGMAKPSVLLIITIPYSRIDI